MSKHKAYILICGLGLLAGCANYTANSLSSLSPADTTIHSQQASQVSVSWKVFDKRDCETYLDRDVLAKGYVPVQVTIRNDSNNAFYLNTGNFNIPLAPPKEVARKMHTSTVGRVVGWGIGGLVLWPLLIPAVYDGIKSNESNNSLDDDYESKALHDQTITPHSAVNNLIFIPKKEMNRPIQMFLVNEKTDERITFSMAK